MSGLPVPGLINTGVSEELSAHLADILQNGVHEIATTADLTLYVDATLGDDTNDGLTTGAGALKTIQAAINKIPQIVNHTVTVNAALGTYDEAVYVFGFVGKGAINIYGASQLVDADNYTVRYIFTHNCAIPIFVRGFKSVSTTTHSFIAEKSAYAQFLRCKVSGNPNTAFLARNGGTMEVNECNALNCGVAVASYHSRLFSLSNTGTGNTYALYASNAGTIGKAGTQPSGTTAESVSNGSVIR